MAPKRASSRALWDRHDLGALYEAVPSALRLAIMDANRGPFQEISGRQAHYALMLKGMPGQILDAGCGRGELLNLLRLEGLECWGAEIDPLMVAEARKLGVHVLEMDVLSALRSGRAGHAGRGLCRAGDRAPVPGGYYRAALKLARQKLAPGGRIILETLNPASLGVLAKSYYRDLEHKQPIHPEYLKLLLEMVGFEQVELHYLSPFNENERLPELPPAAEIGLPESARHAFQERLDRLNALLFGMQGLLCHGSPGTSTPSGQEEASYR